GAPVPELAIFRRLGLAVVRQLLARAKIWPVSGLSPVANQPEARCDLHEPRIRSNRSEIGTEQRVLLDRRLEFRVLQKLIGLIDAAEIAEGEENPVSHRGVA